MAKHFPLAIFLFFYLVYSILSFRAFGNSWDEWAVYERGKMLYLHMIDPGSPSDLNLLKRDFAKDVWPTYNSAYAALLFAFNKNQSYEKYHLENLLFASLIFITAYFFLYSRYKNSWLSILGPIAMVFNPVFFGALANNPKDISFAVYYFLGAALIFLTSKMKNPLVRSLILGLVFGLAQTARVIGFSLYLILFLYDCQKKDPKTKPAVFLFNQTVMILMIYIVSNTVILFTWPYVASNYFKHLYDVFVNSKSFPWDGKIFFLGKEYLSQELFPVYLPVLLLVTMPVFVIFGLVSNIVFIRNLVKNDVFLISFSVILVNAVLYLILRPVLYDGLRHYLFILPFFSILSVLFMIETVKSDWPKISKRLIIVFFLANMFLIGKTEIELFPYHYIYFNEIINGISNGQKYFETDYANNSFKEAINWLKKNRLEKDKKYYIYTCSSSWSLNDYFGNNVLKTDNRQKADYAICLSRGGEYKTVPGKIIHTVSRDKATFNYVIDMSSF